MSQSNNQKIIANNFLMAKLYDTIAEIKKETMALEEEEQAKNKVKQWEPQGGDWYINSLGRVKQGASMANSQLLGVERPTQELAERAAREMRIHNRLLAYRDEFCPEYEPDWANHTHSKFRLQYGHAQKKFFVDENTYLEVFGAVYFPQAIAVQLVEKLNSGEVVL